MELGDDTRPLTARSVVASTLLGVRPSELPARSLVASAGLFGIAEGTVRTAVEGIEGYYPAFDITPPHLIAGIVTDRGIFPPTLVARYWQTP